MPATVSGPEGTQPNLSNSAVGLCVFDGPREVALHSSHWLLSRFVGLPPNRHFQGTAWDRNTSDGRGLSGLLSDVNGVRCDLLRTRSPVGKSVRFWFGTRLGSKTVYSP